MVLSVEWSQNASAHSNGGLAIEALVVILSWLFRHLNHHHRIVGTTMGETSMNPLRYLLACAAWLGLSVVVMGQTTVPAVQLTPAAPATSVVKELKSDSEINAKDTDDPVRKGSYMKTVTYKMEAGKFYRIDMVSKDEGFDPYLRLEDPAGKLVGQDDDGGGFPHARLIYKAATTGDHKIICTTFGPGMTGKFLLTVVGSSEAELAPARPPLAALPAATGVPRCADHAQASCRHQGEEQRWQVRAANHRHRFGGPRACVGGRAEVVR